jgi:hypothetical protein
MSWPEPQRPGEPAESSRAWHWVSRLEDYGRHAQPVSWNAALRRWTLWDGGSLTPAEAVDRLRYHGPAMTPDETEAKVAEAVAAAVPPEPDVPRGLAALAASAEPPPPPAMVYRKHAIRNHILIFAGTLFGTLFLIEKFNLMR